MTDQNRTEIEPLSDEALEEVAGGSSSESCCSCSGCSNSTREPTPMEPAPDILLA